MTCDRMSVSTVFQSYQDDDWVMKKDYHLGNGTAFTVGKITASSGARTQDR